MKKIRRALLMYLLKKEMKDAIGSGATGLSMLLGLIQHYEELLKEAIKAKGKTDTAVCFRRSSQKEGRLSWTSSRWFAGRRK